MAPKTGKIGKVTTASAAGGGVGAALAALAVWGLMQAGVDAEAIEGPLTVVFAFGLGLVGGKLVPSEPAAPVIEPGTGKRVAGRD